MKNKHKGYDERKNRILDGAWKLFQTRGYERTTVALIIEELKISKGTFYHYFTSKEQVLDAITDRMSAEALEELQVVIDDSSLEAGPKFNRYMETARQSRLRRIDSIVDATRVLYREENLIIRHKINERLCELALPGLQAIIEQGIREGGFHVSDASAAANLVWDLSKSLAESQMKTLLSHQPAEEKVSAMVRRANFASQALERVLGAKEDTISRPNPEILEFFVRAMEE